MLAPVAQEAQAVGEFLVRPVAADGRHAGALASDLPCTGMVCLAVPGRRRCDYLIRGKVRTRAGLETPPLPSGGGSVIAGRMGYAGSASDHRYW